MSGKELGMIEEKLLAKQKHEFIESLYKIIGVLNEKRGETEGFLAHGFTDAEFRITNQFFNDVLLKLVVGNYWTITREEIIKLMPPEFDKMLLEKAVNTFLFKDM